MIFAARQRAAAGLAQRAAEVDPVEAQDHVGVADRLRRVAGHVQARRERMQRMLRRKARARLDVRQHDGAKALGQRHAPREIGGIDGHAADHEQRTARRLQKVGGARNGLCRRGARRRRLEAVERRQRHGRRRGLPPAAPRRGTRTRVLAAASTRFDTHAGSPRAPPAPIPAGRPTSCSRAPARPDRATCGSSRPTGAASWRPWVRRRRASEWECDRTTR